MYINHNKMASNVANNLTSHYSNLATSTQRLSSGLRVNSAADDAAGLAIRELMRSDIAALNQGVRNANDGISLIQTADGALGVIDEKLIRMKELAEQAATGTYDSTQRLMIDSEYQQMASEITRIANATDFNGTKLLDGTLAGEHDGSGLNSTGKMKIHFGPENDSAEDYYYIEIGEATSEAFGLGNNSKWEDVQARGVKDFKASLNNAIKNNTDLTAEEKGRLYDQVEAAATALDDVLKNATDYQTAYKNIDKTDKNASALMTKYLEAAAGAAPVEPQQATEEQIAAQYLKDKNIKNMSDAQTKDTGAWNDAQTAANKKTASDADAFKEWLVLNDHELADVDKAAGGADEGTWNTALGKVQAAAIAKLDDADIYAKYIELKVGAGKTTAAGAKGDTAAAYTWATAQTDANTALGRTANDDEVFSYYLNGNGVKGVFENGTEKYAAARQDNADAAKGWTAAAKNLAGTPDDKDVYAQWIVDKDFETTAKADTDLNKGWDKAKENASKDSANYTSARPATEAEAYSQYIATKLALSTANAKKWNNSESLGTNALRVDESNWNAAKAKVQADIDKAAADQAGKVDPEAIDKFWNSLTESDQQKLKYEFGKNAANLIANNDAKIDTTAIKFDNADILNGAKAAMNTQVQSRDFAGYSIETQENAQNALVAVTNAIEAKDKTRAHLGALQNRLENTVSNLTIQSENLQAAESRISDVDVATEMTQFVRNQILTQSAVAMLSQANSMPQMAMQLIG